jgi:DNA-binding response OmpR family regulator
VIDPHTRAAEFDDRTDSSSGPRILLLFTCDRALDQLVADALLGTSAIVLIARTVSDALQIACGRGRELDFAIVDIGLECRGMTLLSAVHTCYDALPILVTTARQEEQFRTLALANGARACLKKPLTAAALRDGIRAVSSSRNALDLRCRPEASGALDSLGTSSEAGGRHHPGGGGIVHSSAP